MTETIEGTAVEVPESRALVAQPGNALVARGDSGPADMIGMATQLATALKDIVERQKLYTVINGKKFPQVEAWMTIGRMDNVVAREAERPIRNEDGSYEAFVELIRLSDGMVIGRASALCGTPDDNQWAKRGEPARRSMAVTRATSRAFRQQYSWIMALAGYMPTPAEEMPQEDSPPPAKPSGPSEAFLGVLKDRTGTVKKGDAEGYKLESRETPDGHAIGFRVEFPDVDPQTGDKKHIPQVLVQGDLGEALWKGLGGKPETLLKQKVTVRGLLFQVSQPGRTSYYRLVVQRITVEGDDGFTLPAEVIENLGAGSGDNEAETIAERAAFVEDTGPEPPPDVELVGEAEAETAPLGLVS